jgi:hypothetical protein
MVMRAEIHTFAQKWQHLFETNAVAQSAGYSQTLEDDLKAAGFEMDQFASLTPDQVQLPDKQDVSATNAFIQAVTDSQALGNGIYSMWRQVTYWHQQSLGDTVNRQWFDIAFAQLAKLTQPLGDIHAVTVDSRRTQPFHFAESALVSQQLELQDTGDVSLKIQFGSGYIDHQNAKISDVQAKNLIKWLSTLEASSPAEVKAIPGTWQLTLQGEGGTETMSGDLDQHPKLSEAIRKVLPFPQLLLFDNAPEYLTRLIAEFTSDANTHEKLVIDRHSQTLSLTTRHGQTRSRVAVADPQVIALMDALLHQKFVGLTTPDSTLPLAVTVRYRYASSQKFYGTLSLDHPIINWQDAASLIGQCVMKFYPNMIDQRLITRHTPQPGDLLYAKVVFHHGEHPYSYLATPDFAIGDRVVVPTTYSMQYGTIVAMDYYSPLLAPYPPEKTKSILRLADPVEESQYNSDDYDD